MLPVSAQISQTQSGAERQSNLTTWKKEESVRSASPLQPSYPSPVMQKGKKKRKEKELRGNIHILKGTLIVPFHLKALWSQSL